MIYSVAQYMILYSIVYDNVLQYTPKPGLHNQSDPLQASHDTRTLSLLVYYIITCVFLL